MADKVPWDPSKFCILTFYSAQERLLRIEMDRFHKAKPQLGVDLIKVATVDKFQGHEADVVILDRERLLRIEMDRFHKAKPELGVESIRIATVDKFQGHEADVRALNYVWSAELCIDTCSACINGWICTPKFISAHVEHWISQKNEEQGLQNQENVEQALDDPDAQIEPGTVAIEFHDTDAPKAEDGK
ncbi:hypothetical protein N7528_006798 [Penicillium herquei]|nr:hypothetical protein N7528_006798 [Penicillium herquei]